MSVFGDHNPQGVSPLRRVFSNLTTLVTESGVFSRLARLRPVPAAYDPVKAKTLDDVIDVWF